MRALASSNTVRSRRGGVLLFALVLVLAASAASALAAQTAEVRSRAAPTFDHCLFGKWVLRGSSPAAGNPTLIGMTLDVTPKGKKDAATFIYDLDGSAGLPSGTLRGTASMIVSTSGDGSMGVVSYSSHLTVTEYGNKLPAGNPLILGNNTIYKCSSSAFLVTWTDGGLVSKATFRRP